MIDFAALMADVDDLLRSAGVPGAALAIVQGTNLVHTHAFGLTAVGLDQQVMPDTLFQIGSTTKPLTGTLIMRLVDGGVLDLDLPIREWLPDVRFNTSGAVDTVTLGMLLSHTAGLPWDQITPLRMYGGRDAGALSAWVRDELPSRPLVGPPGAQWNYSNPGIILAGYIAEVATGRPYATLMREQVFEPLEMPRTTFDPTEAMTWPIAQAHATAPTGESVVIHRAADNASQYPAAFAWSNVLELANCAIAHLNGGTFHDNQVLSEAAVRAMHAPRADRGDKASSGAYGLTFMIDDWKGLTRISHAGGINGFSCEFDLIPEVGVGIIALCNVATGDELRPAVDACLAGLTGVKGS